MYDPKLENLDSKIFLPSPSKPSTVDGTVYVPGPGTYHLQTKYALKIFETKIFEFDSKFRPFVLKRGGEFVVERTGVLLAVLDAL